MKVKLRASKISIESPRPDSELWLHLELSQVIYNDTGEIINILPRIGYISKPIKELMQKTFNIVTDTGETHKILGKEAIGMIYWVIIDILKTTYNAELDKEGNLWLSSII